MWLGSAKEQVSRCNLFGVGQKGKKNKVDPTDLDSLKSHLCFLNQSTPAQLEMLLLDTKAHSLATNLLEPYQARCPQRGEEVPWRWSTPWKGTLSPCWGNWAGLGCKIGQSKHLSGILQALCKGKLTLGIQSEIFWMLCCFTEVTTLTQCHWNSNQCHPSVRYLRSWESDL